MPWMAALDVWACGGVIVVVVLRISLQLRGHDDDNNEGYLRANEVSNKIDDTHVENRFGYLQRGTLTS